MKKRKGREKKKIEGKEGGKGVERRGMGEKEGRKDEGEKGVHCIAPKGYKLVFSAPSVL